ncbi:MAG: hypothetical protein GY810_11410 [Aureispira sp.]|nr:hypothetical protein [Aureispira sp.]
MRSIYCLYIIVICLLVSCKTTEIVLNKYEDEIEDEKPILELPAYLFKLRKPLKLHIYNMGLDTLPENISQVKNLQGLELTGGRVSYLSESFGQLKKMKSLGLSDSRIKKLPKSFNQLKNLEELSLRGSSLDSLSFATICKLKKLKGLYLEYLEKLPTCIIELPKLKRLAVKGFDLAITSSKSVLWELINLESLSIYSERDLEQLPEELGQLQNLKRLNLMNNSLKELPKSLWTLTNLEFLYLENNEFDNSITVALKNINKLKKLKDFRIGDFRPSIPVRKLPESIGELVNLEKLELNRTQLTNLPQSISDLKKLKQLFLSYNRLTTLPDLSSLKNLEKLSVYGNKLTKLPDLSSLVQLEYLSISHNPIDTILGLEYLEDLKVLSINHTKIDTLPRTTLKKLQNLEKLYIDTHQKHDFKKEYNWKELLPNCEIRVVSRKY